MATSDQILSRLRRTLSSIFRIGDIQIKDNTGVAEIRNSDDSAYADLTINDGNVNSIQFDLAPTVTPEEGRLYWNADDGTLDVGMPGGNVNLQLGQEILVRARNETGSLIPNGTVVYIAGASGSRPTIGLATATDHSIAESTIGFTTEDIANNGNGYVTTFGLVRDVDTSAYTAGDKIYLSTTAGLFTNTAPAPPNTRVDLGIVLFANAGSGIIFVETDTIHELNELSNINITAIADGQVIYWDSGTSTWINVDPNGLGITLQDAYNSSTDGTITTDGTRTGLDIVGGADTAQLIVKANATQTSNILEVKNSSNVNLFVIDGSGKVGVGVTAPVNLFSVVQNIDNIASAISGVTAKIQPTLSSITPPVGYYGLSINPIYSAVSGTLSSFFPLLTTANITSSGTVTNVYGIRHRTNIQNAGGSVGNNYDIYIESPALTGTMTNHYGLYIQNINNASSLNYAIYTNLGQVRFGDTVEIADSATNPPLNLTERSTEPSSPSSNDIYLDDGTNSDSGTPTLRRYTGSVWEDINGSVLQVTDGTTTVDPTSIISLDPTYFDVTDSGGGTATVSLVNTTGINVSRWESLSFTQATSNDSLIFAPPANAIYSKTVVVVTVASGGGSPTISVGTSVDNDAYVETGDVNLLEARIFEVHRFVDLGASPSDVRFYITPDGQTFSGEIYVQYYDVNGSAIISPTSGFGDVLGAGSSTDNAIVRFDGTGGKTIQNSGITIDDNNTMTFPDSAVDPPLNLTERSTEPSSPSTGDIYLDDGTNSVSGEPAFRRYTGSVWEDIGGGTGGGGSSVSEKYFLTSHKPVNQDSLVYINKEIPATYGSDQLTGGTATASNSFSTNTPDKAVNNNTADGWSTSGVGDIAWWAYDFGANKTIRRYTIELIDGSATNYPIAWTFEYWDGSAWQIADTRTGVSTWSAGEQKTFDVSDAYTSDQWRFNLTDSNTGDYHIAEFQMFEVATSSGGNDKLAQSFQISATAVISKAYLYLQRFGTLAGTLTLRVETDNAGSPSGTLVDANATTTLAESSLDSSLSMVTFDFATDFSVSLTTTYWLVLSTSSSSSPTNYLAWGEDTTAGYANGELKSEASSVWSAESSDAIFQVISNGIIGNRWSYTNTSTYTTTSATFVEIDSTNLTFQFTSNGRPTMVIAEVGWYNGTNGTYNMQIALENTDTSEQILFRNQDPASTGSVFSRTFIEFYEFDAGTYNLSWKWLRTTAGTGFIASGSVFTIVEL